MTSYAHVATQYTRTHELGQRPITVNLAVARNTELVSSRKASSDGPFYPVGTGATVMPNLIGSGEPLLIPAELVGQQAGISAVSAFSNIAGLPVPSDPLEFAMNYVFGGFSKTQATNPDESLAGRLPQNNVAAVVGGTITTTHHNPNVGIKFMDQVKYVLPRPEQASVDNLGRLTLWLAPVEPTDNFEFVHSVCKSAVESAKKGSPLFTGNISDFKMGYIKTMEALVEAKTRELTAFGMAYVYVLVSKGYLHVMSPREAKRRALEREIAAMAIDGQAQTQAFVDIVDELKELDKSDPALESDEFDFYDEVEKTRKSVDRSQDFETVVRALSGTTGRAILSPSRENARIAFEWLAGKMGISGSDDDKDVTTFAECLDFATCGRDPSMASRFSNSPEGIFGMEESGIMSAFTSHVMDALGTGEVVSSILDQIRKRTIVGTAISNVGPAQPGSHHMSKNFVDILVRAPH